MDYTHPLDRLMLRLRTPIMIGAGFAAPVMVYSYGWLMVKAYELMPGWAFAASFIAHLIVWVGIGCLVDSLREQHPSKESAQSKLPAVR